jgi:hypothetical protein
MALVEVIPHFDRRGRTAPLYESSSTHLDRAFFLDLFRVMIDLGACLIILKTER